MQVLGALPRTARTYLALKLADCQASRLLGRAPLQCLSVITGVQNGCRTGQTCLPHSRATSGSKYILGWNSQLSLQHPPPSSNKRALFVEILCFCVCWTTENHFTLATYLPL